MKTPHMATTILNDLLIRMVERLRLPRMELPGEAHEPGARPGKVSKLGPRPDRYHHDALTRGRRLFARRLRRWLRSG